MTFHLSAQVKRVMTQAAITMDELEVMVQRSAIVTNPDGNRRYHDWLLNIDGDNILLLRKMKLTRVGRGKIPMHEECPECEGEGCPECGYAGQIIRLI